LGDEHKARVVAAMRPEIFIRADQDMLVSFYWGIIFGLMAKL
jgi:hypothetical protein